MPHSPEHSGSAPRPGIDPRSPRFGAAITAVLLAVVIVLELTRPSTVIGSFSYDSSTGGDVLALLPYRLSDPALWLFVLISALFAWGAFAGIRRHPYGALFRALLRPRLAPPAELEDAAPPTFAQGVGFAISIAGIVLQPAGVPYALLLAASAAFLAAFLNSVFAFCLGCQLYLGLRRLGLLRRPATV